LAIVGVRAIPLVASEFLKNTPTQQSFPPALSSTKTTADGGRHRIADDVAIADYLSY
jgi:hypothetical protein